MRKILIRSHGSRLRTRFPFIKGLKIFGSFLFYALFLFVLASFILSKIGPTWQIKYTGCEMRTVLTGSMTGTLDKGTTIVSTRVKPENLRVGDIITFITSDSDVISSEEKIITHRIIKVLESYIDVTNGKLRFIFKTKGDANPTEDRFFVDQEQVISKYLFSIPLSTFINQNLIPFIKQPLGIFLLIVSIVSIGAFIVFFLIIRKNKFKEDDREDIEKKVPIKRLTKEHLLDDDDQDIDSDSDSKFDLDDDD